MTEAEILNALSDPDFGLDGRWSPQTKKLIKTLGATELELNKWWALTKQNWICPSCKKSKAQLVRLHKSGRLIAKLVSHHDHVGVAVDNYAPVKWDQETQSREPKSFALREHLKRLAAGFLVRFEPTIICEQCNNAEPEIKKRFGVPGFVSLTPLEIGMLESYFSQPQSDELDQLLEKLRLWAESIHSVLALAQEKYDPVLHSKKLHPIFNTQRVHTDAISTLSRKISSDPVIPSELESDFLHLSESKPSEPNSKRKELPMPTIEAFGTYKHPHAVRQTVIDETDDKWSCPICNRSKFGCFSSSGGTPKIFHLNLFKRKLSESDLDSEEYEITICGHCNDFQNAFRRHLSDIGRDDLVHFVEGRSFDVEIVRSGITVNAHQSHEFHFDKAIAHIESLEQISEQLNQVIEF